MTQPKSLREKLADAKVDAANKFLNDLADNLEERIKSAEVEKIFSYCPGKSRVSVLTAEPHVRFRDNSLNEATVGEIRETSGYARLKKLCASPAIDLCLDIPACYAGRSKHESAPFGDVYIFIERPYADSMYAANERLAARKSRPGLLRRMFNRIRERRPVAPARGGYIEVSSHVPAPTNGPFIPPPGLS